ncbi:unnamed protein product [Withania somnifera]
MENSASHVDEVAMQSSSAKKNATMARLLLAAVGWRSNLIVFLINEFNMKSIAIAKVFNRLTTVFPIVGGIIVDSYLGCFFVIWISSLISAMPLNKLICIFVCGSALASIGIASTRFTIAPMGAYQFDMQKRQAMFFRWYIFIFYLCWALSTTLIVSVEHISWAWGFEQGGSPFVNLARVVAAAIQKWRIPLSELTQDYYHDPSDKTTLVPTKFFKKPWRLCTVKQVNLKSLIKHFLLRASSLLIISTQLVMQLSLLTLQALKMDRHMGPHFDIPAGSMLVFILLFTLHKLFSHPLQRVGIGHSLTIACMAVSALVESRRLRVARSHHLQSKKDAIVPMSIFWLLPQLALNGIGEGFHFPGHIAFYYHELPTSLKNTSTAMVSLFIGITFYLGNVWIDLAQGQSGWLPNNINDGRMDNVFWLCCTLESVNLICFLVFASFYRYRTMDSKPNDVPSK